MVNTSLRFNFLLFTSLLLCALGTTACRGQTLVYQTELNIASIPEELAKQQEDEFLEMLSHVPSANSEQVQKMNKDAYLKSRKDRMKGWKASGVTTYVVSAWGYSLDTFCAYPSEKEGVARISEAQFENHLLRNWHDPSKGGEVALGRAGGTFTTPADYFALSGGQLPPGATKLPDSSPSLEHYVVNPDVGWHGDLYVSRDSKGLVKKVEARLGAISPYGPPTTFYSISGKLGEVGSELERGVSGVSPAELRYRYSFKLAKIETSAADPTSSFFNKGLSISDFRRGRTKATIYPWEGHLPTVDWLKEQDERKDSYVPEPSFPTGLYLAGSCIGAGFVALFVNTLRARKR